MTPFPTTLLVTDIGQFGPSLSGGCFIRVPIQPFALNGQNFQTSLRLDDILLPSHNLTCLSKTEVVFPVNPELGYIDGSMYLDGAHHPVDVRHMKFGLAEGRTISTHITSDIDFGFEGFADFAKTPWIFDVLLTWTDEVQVA